MQHLVANGRSVEVPRRAASLLIPCALLTSFDAGASEPPSEERAAGETTVAASAQGPERRGLGARASLGLGVFSIQGTIGGHAWLTNHVGLGVRYNGIGVSELFGRSGAVHTLNALLLLRSRADGHYAFATFGGGWGAWRTEDPEYTTINKLGFGSTPEPPRRGQTSHFSIEAGYLWQIGLFEVGPTTRLDFFRLEEDGMTIAFGPTLGLCF